LGRYVGHELNVGYAGTSSVVKVNFEVDPGQCLVLRGRSGSGKTTILRSLFGLALITSGHLEIEGSNCEKWQARNWDAHRRVTGYCPQTPTLPDFLTVEESFDLMSRVRRLSSNHARESMASYLELLGIGQYKSAVNGSLSAGQRQRALLAILFSLPLNMVALDEPTSHLDAESTSLFLQAVSCFRQDNKECVLLVATHDELVGGIGDKEVHL
jgi:ABC-type multidrug transport system ATPase subunit